MGVIFSTGCAALGLRRAALHPWLQALAPLGPIVRGRGANSEWRGSGVGEESGCEPGKKCRLQIDHVVPISQGGTDEHHNLRAVCVYYNKDKANLKMPTSRDAISVMALIRRQPRDVQKEVYEFLARKLKKESGE